MVFDTTTLLMPLAFLALITEYLPHASKAGRLLCASCPIFGAIHPSVSSFQTLFVHRILSIIMILGSRQSRTPHSWGSIKQHSERDLGGFGFISRTSVADGKFIFFYFFIFYLDLRFPLWLHYFILIAYTSSSPFSPASRTRKSPVPFLQSRRRRYLPNH